MPSLVRERDLTSSEEGPTGLFWTGDHREPNEEEVEMIAGRRRIYLRRRAGLKTGYIPHAIAHFELPGLSAGSAHFDEIIKT